MSHLNIDNSNVASSVTRTKAVGKSDTTKRSIFCQKQLTSSISSVPIDQMVPISIKLVRYGKNLKYKKQHLLMHFRPKNCGQGAIIAPLRAHNKSMECEWVGFSVHQIEVVLHRFLSGPDSHNRWTIP